MSLHTVLVGAGSERRRSWRTQVGLECILSRTTGKTIEAKTMDVGPGGMRVHTTRPLAVDELLEFELPDPDGYNLVFFWKK